MLGGDAARKRLSGGGDWGTARCGQVGQLRRVEVEYRVVQHAAKLGDRRAKRLPHPPTLRCTNAQFAVAVPRWPLTVTLPDTTWPRAGTGCGARSAGRPS